MAECPTFNPPDGRDWHQCPSCKNWRHLRPCDIRRNIKRGSVCKSCQTSAAGKKGYRSAVSKYGRDFGLKHVREYRLKNPSRLELHVANLLNQCSLSYEREVLVECKDRTYLVDFIVYVQGKQVAIEVNGEWVHRNRSAYDVIKFTALQSSGFSPLTIRESAIANNTAIRIIKNHFNIQMSNPVTV